MYVGWARMVARRTWCGAPTVVGLWPSRLCVSRSMRVLDAGPEVVPVPDFIFDTRQVCVREAVYGREVREDAVVLTLHIPC